MSLQLDTITRKDATRLVVLMDEAAAAVASLAPAFNPVIEAIRNLVPIFEESAGWMPGPEFRRARKVRQLREHRERVAARVPEWKRTASTPMDVRP